MEKTSEPLSHPYTYTAAPQLRGMSQPQTCALDMGQTREFLIKGENWKFGRALVDVHYLDVWFRVK
jgi:hypothetical protein